MRSFITGSQAYGFPKPKSDIDIVLLISRDTLDRLAELSDEQGSGEACGYCRDSASLRFGRLNLICFTSRTPFLAWRTATEELVAMKPVARDQAVELIQRRLAEFSGRSPRSFIRRVVALMRASIWSKPQSEPSVKVTLPL